MVKQVFTYIDNPLISSYDFTNSGVFTNGCFDIIHKGHIHLLKYCYNLNIKPVIVGLNSDKSIKKLKGDNRPFMDEQNRISILESIKYIDYIVLFDDITVLPLIKKIKPNVLVKGGSTKLIVGKDYVENYGGVVMKTNIIPDISTTKIIEKMEGEKL